MKRNLFPCFCYKTLFVCLPFFLVILMGCQSPSQSKIQSMPDLSFQDQEAIASQAVRTSHQYMMNMSHGKQDNMIPSQYWGDAITKLKPLRVMFDRVNVVIVMKEDQDYEEGYYIIPIISSYVPNFETKYVEFKEFPPTESHPFNSLYHYKIQKDNF